MLLLNDDQSAQYVVTIEQSKFILLKASNIWGRNRKQLKYNIMYKIDNNHQRWGWLCADNHHQKEMAMHKISNYTTKKIENLKHVQHTITKCI